MLSIVCQVCATFVREEKNSKKMHSFYIALRGVISLSQAACTAAQGHN
jgi:hypothetical protein